MTEPQERLDTVIGVFLGIPEAFARRAEHVFGVFADRWGIAYFCDAHDRREKVSYVPFDERLYDWRCDCVARERDDHIWSPADVDVRSADVVGVAYRLLTLLDERHVPPEARDRRGIFLADALPPARRSVADILLVDVLERLVEAWARAERSAVPKPPEAERSAVAVMHDTDSVTLGEFPECSRTSSKAPSAGIRCAPGCSSTARDTSETRRRPRWPAFQLRPG